MQKGSSGNKTRKKKKRPNGPPQGRSQRDNVYELNRIRQKRENENRYYGRTQPQPVPRVHQRPMPVSYTHLDVYKRQVLDFWQAFGL